MNSSFAMHDWSVAEQIRNTWHERNARATELGLAWIDSLLAGAEDAQTQRAAYERQREAMRQSGEPANIDRLSGLFHLAPFDEDILLLLLGAQLNARPQQATPQLAFKLFCAGREAAAKGWERLGPYQPLRRFQLIECGKYPISALLPIQIEERVSRYLMGEDISDARLSTALSPVIAGPFPKRHAPQLDRLLTELKASNRAAAMILGSRRSGRRATAVALAAGFGLGAAEIKPRALEAAPELLPLLAREAALSGFALVIDIGPPEGLRMFEERLGQFDGLVIAIAESRPDLPFEVPFQRLEFLSAADRAQIWRDALGPRAKGRECEIDALAEQFKFGPREISAAAAQGGDLWQACRDRAGRDLESLAERIVPRFGWDDIVLPADVLHDLQAAAAQVRHRSLVYDAQGFAAKLARGRGISVLLAGPSGVGKTMAAEIIAHELALDLYRIDLSSVVSKYIGETEKNLRAVFDAAEASGAVLFFDEADALFGRRSEVKDSHDRYANIEVSYLLQRMESYSGLAILATNMKSYLDTAFLRRIRFAIDIPFPDATTRRQIWIKSFPQELPKAELDYDALARLEIAGGNIAVIAVNAAFLAAADGCPLTMRHIARAAKAEFRKLDKELRATWFAGAGNG